MQAKATRDFQLIIDWNNGTELAGGMCVWNPLGCVVTWHPGDRTWMIHLNLLVISLSFGYCFNTSADAEFTTCELCQGAGQICTGTSGSEADGNAPIIEPCEACNGTGVAK